MPNKKPNILIYIPFYSGKCESRHARMHDIIQYLNKIEKLNFNYHVVAERGTKSDSDKVWFPKLAFLGKYTKTYQRKNNAKQTTLAANTQQQKKKAPSTPSSHNQPIPPNSDGPKKNVLFIVVKKVINIFKKILRKTKKHLRKALNYIKKLARTDFQTIAWQQCRKKLIEKCNAMNSIDILHIVRPNKTSDKLIDIFKAKNPKLKVIIGPNLMAYGHPSNAFNIDQFSDPAISSVIAISSYHKQLLEDFGFPNDILSRLPPSVHPDYFSPATDSKTTNNEINDFTILFAASQLSVEKGTQEFLLALKKIKNQSLFNFKAIVIGSESVNQSVQTATNKQIIEEASSYVRFAGKVERINMREYYSTADVFVHCGEPENGPTTIIESLSCGTPCVLTDHICFHEPELESACHFYQKGNIDELIEQLIEVHKKQKRPREKAFLPTISHRDSINFLSSLYSDNMMDN